LVILAWLAAAVQLGHRLFGEAAAAIELRLLLLLQKQGTDQADDRGVTGEDTDDPGAAFALFVQSLQWVGAPDLAPVLG